MAGRAKKRKVVGVSRAVFADNLRRAMDARYHGEGDRPLALAKASEVGKSSIQRWLAQTHSPNLDQIEAVSRALKLLPHQLLMPMFGVEDRSEGHKQRPRHRPEKQPGQRRFTDQSPLQT